MLPKESGRMDRLQCLLMRSHRIVCQVRHLGRTLLMFAGNALVVIKLIIVVWLILLIGGLYANAADTEHLPPKRVLAILFYGEGRPFPEALVESLRAHLKLKSPFPVKLNVEYADRMRYPDEDYLRKLISLYRHKYFEPQMDVIVGVGDEAADIIVDHGEAMFGKQPMVLITANPKYRQRRVLKPYMTSLLWRADIHANVRLIERLLPEARQLFIISGSSLTDQEGQKLARTSLRKYDGPLEINYISDISKEDLLEKVARLPKNSVLFQTSFTRDSKGKSLISRDILSAISKKANVPLFGITESYIGYGTVGGNMLSGENQGQRIADIAVRILNGESPSDIHPSHLLNRTMFDWRQLKRWNIPEDRLPPGSIIRFKSPSYWDLYRWYIVTALLIILFESGLISHLLIQRRKRRRAEGELSERLAFEEMLSALSARLIELHPERVDAQIAQELKMVGEFLKVDRINVFEFSANSQQLFAVQSFTSSGVAQAPLQVETSRFTWTVTKIRNGETVYFSDPADLPVEAKAERAYLQAEGIRSAVFIPFTISGSPQGLLTLAMVNQPRKWSEGMIRRYGMVAEIIANALSRKLSEKALRQSKNFNRLILDSLPYHVAVLDGEGTILDVNESWKRFALENPPTASEDCIGHGVNYLQVCRRSAVSGDELAETALEGIQSVLEGTQAQFVLEYPCDSPQEKRWFIMRVIPFSGRKGGVIISHIENTDRKLAEIDLQNAYAEIEQLKNQLEAETAYLREEIQLEHDFEGIIGQSAAIQYVLYKIQQVAATDTSVLVLGETGTGKELVCRAVHNNSVRKARPLVKVNCAALPSNLIESELFGHERGAFTGAQARRTGRFEVANGTAIFLDEIAELPLELQGKLLRVLQDGEFERLGSSMTKKVDVRVIAATNRDLEEQVRIGRFREDLFYRLNVFPITVPPLRDRVEDIALLGKFFMEKAAKRLGRTIEFIPENVMTQLQEYPWPGNVRELENVIERAVISTVGPKLRLADISLAGAKSDAEPLKSLQDIEKEHIIRVLEKTNWRVDGPKGAAKILELNPSTLRSRMRKLGIKKP